ncbi:DUF3240 domain-containing protein [Sphingobium sp. PAMC28499]|uniref:DUF3240 family protein n=1 Tax=Sphingobium sp. PAMC28499 TaxID=2565554 RepID=UPI00109DD3D3|nr:DUF3240 family protein [Sphingobium sp. PAMC28499]QCB40144.1 DUF3240 domain-containing protein [Sphingobium sp. PAMC28499]
MTDMLLTFYCAAIDRDGVADALRSRTPAPLHLRDEQVLGCDFADAGAGEQVRGALRRAAIDLIVPADDIDPLVVAVTDARRGHPVRWHACPVAARGRIA